MAIFSQRHYVKAAEWVSDESWVNPDKVEYLTHLLCRKFQSDNPRFKEHLFRKACKERAFNQ